MKSEAVIKTLSALAHPSRLDVFRLLVRRGPEGYAPGDLGTRLGIPGPTLSFHLKELSLAGLIESRREGRHLYYGASMAHMNALVSFLTENCCSLGSSDSASCRPAAASRTRKIA
jgi:ArsR family transcriptional regulator